MSVAKLDDVAEPLLARVGAHLPREGRRGRDLALLLRGGDGVLVALERVVAQVVLAQDADDVDVALEHVLELAALPADGDQHLVAVERALALADGLVPVRRLLEEVHGGDDGLPRRARVPRAQRGAREVEPARAPRRRGPTPRRTAPARAATRAPARVPKSSPRSRRSPPARRAPPARTGRRPARRRRAPGRGSAVRSAHASSVRAWSIGGTPAMSARCVRSLPAYQSSVSAARAARASPRLRHDLAKLGRGGDVVLFPGDGVLERGEERVLRAREVAARPRRARLVAELVDGPGAHGGRASSIAGRRMEPGARLTGHGPEANRSS